MHSILAGTVRTAADISVLPHISPNDTAVAVIGVVVVPGAHGNDVVGVEDVDEGDVDEDVDDYKMKLRYQARRQTMMLVSTVPMKEEEEHIHHHQYYYYYLHDDDDVHKEVEIVVVATAVVVLHKLKQ